MKSKKSLDLLKQRIICAKGEKEFDLLYKQYYEVIKEDLNRLEKQDKAIEIVKNKLVYPLALISLPYELYNKSVMKEQQLIQEEFNLVKEVFR